MIKYWMNKKLVPMRYVMSPCQILLLHLMTNECDLC